MMKGAILSGGYGKRLYPFTRDLPKTMLEIKRDVTILDIQLLDFKRTGIDEVYLLVGYKKELIENRYGETWNGLRIRYLEEETPMGTLWAIKNLYEHDSSDFIIRNGDTICDADPNELRRRTEQNGKKMGLLATKMISPYGILEIKGNKVINFREKPVLNFYINGGFYYFSRDLTVYLNKEYQEKEIERSVFPSLAEIGQIYAFKHTGLWKSIDSIKDYEEAIKIFQNRKDYDFGYITDNFIMLYSGKTAKLDGKAKIKLLRGKAKLGNEYMKIGVEYDVDGEIVINSIRQSYLSYGGKIDNR